MGRLFYCHHLFAYVSVFLKKTSLSIYIFTFSSPNIIIPQVKEMLKTDVVYLDVSKCGPQV